MTTDAATVRASIFTEPECGQKGVILHDMGDEPSLYEGDLDVNGWVETLQLALRRAGQQVDVDGKFGETTRRAVVAAQQAAGIEHDGVVGNQTWALLMQRAPEPPGVNNGPHGGLHPPANHPTTPASPTPASSTPTGPPAPGPDPTRPYAGTIWEPVWDHGYASGKDDPTGTFTAPQIYDEDAAKVWLAGVRAGQESAMSDGRHPSQAPAVTDGDPAPGPVSQGLPTLRITVPNIEMAGTTLDTPTAYLIITAGITGSGSVSVDPPSGPIAVSADQTGYRTEIRSQLDGLFSGIRISGITGGLTGGTMSLSSTWGNQWATSEVRMISPTQVRYIGQATLSGIEVPVSAGSAQLQGAFGFYVDLEIHPKPPPVPVEEPEPDPWYERAWDWAGDHAEGLVVGVVVITVGVAVLGPGGLVLAIE
jgi:peptidoglycan hydrolase-like protein with peptidoglycan-binding domain